MNGRAGGTGRGRKGDRRRDDRRCAAVDGIAIPGRSRVHAGGTDPDLVRGPAAGAADRRRVHRARAGARRHRRADDAQPHRARAGRPRRGARRRGPHAPLRHPRARTGGLRRRRRTARYAVLDGPDQLDRWQPVLSRPARAAEDHRAGTHCPSGATFLSLGVVPRTRRSRDLRPLAGRDPRRHADRPLHLRHDRQPEGRGDHPPHGDVRVPGVERTSSLPPQSVGVSYLPFAHIADRVLSLYLPLVRASHVYFCTDLAQLPRRPRPGKPARLLRRAARVGEDDGRLQAALGRGAGRAAETRSPTPWRPGAPTSRPCEYGRIDPAGGARGVLARGRRRAGCRSAP